MQAWQAALIDYIEKEFVIDVASPREEVVQLSDEVKAVLVGPDDATYLWRRHEDGRKCEVRCCVTWRGCMSCLSSTAVACDMIAM